MATFDPYTGDGATTQFDITFSYDDAETVYVTVDGIDTSFQFINPSRVELDTAPPSGAEVLVYRRTDVSTPAVDFSDGAIILADDLDLAVGQARNRVQEIDSEFVSLDRRAIKLPFGDSYTLPLAAERANQVLGTDGAGAMTMLDKSAFRGPAGASTDGIGLATELPTMVIPAPYQTITTTGYYSNGDLGWGRYRRTATPPTVGFQSEDGSYWALMPENNTVYIEQLGGKPDTGNLLTGYTFTGNETDNAPLFNLGFQIADTVAARQSEWWMRYGIKSPIVLVGDQQLGNTLTPGRLQLVALPGFQHENGEAVIQLTKTRTAAEGFTLTIPPEVYDPASDDSSDLVGSGRLSGLSTGVEGAQNTFKYRVWNVDIIGGYQGIAARGFETDYKNVRVIDALVGMDNFAYDNEFSASFSVTECDIGYRGWAGGEGTIHAIRNRVNFDIKSAMPNKLFLFDDTPIELGVRLNGIRGQRLLVFHTKVGEGRTDPATQPAVYFELIDSYHNRIEQIGLYEGTHDQTNITFIRFADTAAMGSGGESVRNVFSNVRMRSVPMADAANEAQAYLQLWRDVNGTDAARFAAPGAYHAVKPISAGAGNTNGADPFRVYLPQRIDPGEAGQVMRVVGYLHARATATSDQLNRVVFRIPLGTDTGASVTLTEIAKDGSSDYTGLALSAPTYNATSGHFETTLTAPTAVFVKANLTVEAVSVI